MKNAGEIINCRHFYWSATIIPEKTAVMRVKAICFLLFAAIFLCHQASAQSTITETTSPKGWLIRTKSSAYQLVVTPAGGIRQVYYGVGEQANFGKQNAQWFEGIDEVPVRGELPFKSPMLEVIFNDNVRDADLQLVKAEITSLDDRPLLKIIQKDRHYPLEVTSFIRVLPEFDMLEKWATIKNTAKKGNIKVENFLSGSIVLPANEYTLTQYSGKAYYEFQPFESSLSPGLKTIENKGFRSNAQAAWFLVRPQGSAGDEGPAWFGSVHYSGNWKLAFDKTFNGNLQILGGINFWDTALNLQPGQSFETPKFSVGYTDLGEEGAAQNHSAYIRKAILPQVHRNDLRPVLYNSWYATKENLSEPQQVDLARVASEIGAELFVIDAGWFKVNNATWVEVGDWEVDKKKFPEGLTSLIKKVNDMGMKFGLWVEPENIHIASDTYKKHPDWALQFDNREGAPRKTLNLANEEVYQHLLKTLTNLLTNNNIDFIKWDQNTFLREPGWPDAHEDVQREVRIRYTQNLYRLIDELRRKFPHVWFESCASGGGRVDPGMLSRMDQAWVSDNTLSIDRLLIQYGYLSAMPANTMVSWVVGNGSYLPLDYKFDVAMTGVLGVGDNISKWTTEEKTLAKRKIELYKLIRPLVQQGTLFRLVSPFKTDRSALQYNSDDQSSGVLICHNMARYLEGGPIDTRGSKTLKLKGLIPGKNYVLKNANNKADQGSVYSGEFLMKIGIAWPLVKQFESKIILIDQVD